ncbi:hypothetical protein DM01DRAFT_1407734 [Hesseltinella vesiculosa]|uniref:DUF8032 domain-containing protein n=1 Tax=Hesseltinella vesiculosa TaxID=101127 RepID=A0A1X2GGZ4_9FUNG|nr:hypothetical protein DM01DRAFT_1407734 [Hesseltinella vesiculosa]
MTTTNTTSTTTLLGTPNTIGLDDKSQALSDGLLMPSSTTTTLDLLASVQTNGPCGLGLTSLDDNVDLVNAVDSSFWSSLSSLPNDLPSSLMIPEALTPECTPQQSWSAGHVSLPPTPSFAPYSAPPQPSPIHHGQAAHPLFGDANGITNFLPPTPPIEASYVAHGSLQAPMANLSQCQPNPFADLLMTSPFHPHANMHLQTHQRRRSDQPFQPKRQNATRRRASSVASVVSLTAHEPVAHLIDGIEHITFLYSHDRLVKEYTVRTDVNSVSMDDIPIDFRLQNAIYPRANVDREEYDGNRWNYETSCNDLGWKLCWLNREQLFGKRGLIQRAVDSYRNRHAELRSRRVTRQEKVANGTLRKRRSKKLMHHPFC